MQADAALDPAQRALYAEILRAPAGFRLDAAVTTTYSLDFETALVIPAALAFHAAAEERRETLGTPLALLDGLERMARRIAIFCEASRIHGRPSGANRLRQQFPFHFNPLSFFLPGSRLGASTQVYLWRARQHVRERTGKSRRLRR